MFGDNGCRRRFHCPPVDGDPFYKAAVAEKDLLWATESAKLEKRKTETRVAEKVFEVSRHTKR